VVITAVSVLIWFMINVVLPSPGRMSINRNGIDGRVVNVRGTPTEDEFVESTYENTVYIPVYVVLGVRPLNTKLFPPFVSGDT